MTAYTRTNRPLNATQEIIDAMVFQPESKACTWHRFLSEEFGVRYADDAVKVSGKSLPEIEVDFTFWKTAEGLA